MKTKVNRLTLFLTTIVLCSGCVYAPLPELPDFKTPVKQESIKPIACPDAPIVSCPELLMPEPMPKTAYLDIKDGKVIKADAGGEQLIRQYASIRKAVKALWVK